MSTEIIGGQKDDLHSPTPVPVVPTDDYVFPDFRLKRKMDDPDKTPLLLVACGSFSPITFLHLRMFEMAADYAKAGNDFELVGGYLSPVSDAYRKAGLASADHR
jgi:nicotinamide mononucleotide adenylyltransferase